jgi:hypothetical protein
MYINVTNFLKKNHIKDVELANILDISFYSVKNKLTGKQPFKTCELKVFKQHFNLSDEEFCNIFFN